MPDPNAPAIAVFYCDDDEAMEYLVAFLIRSKLWFDVRRPASHKWYVCFSAIVSPPKRIAAKLIPMKPHIDKTVHAAKDLASYKAGRKALMKPGRR